MNGLKKRRLHNGKADKELIDFIKADYAGWGMWTDDSIKEKMIDSFNSGLGYKEGKKYIKIMKDNGGTPMATVWASSLMLMMSPSSRRATSFTLLVGQRQHGTGRVATSSTVTSRELHGPAQPT